MIYLCEVHFCEKAKRKEIVLEAYLLEVLFEFLSIKEMDLLNLHVVCRIDLVIVGLLVVVEQYSKRK